MEILQNYESKPDTLVSKLTSPQHWPQRFVGEPRNRDSLGQRHLELLMVLMFSLRRQKHIQVYHGLSLAKASKCNK